MRCRRVARGFSKILGLRKISFTCLSFSYNDFNVLLHSLTTIEVPYFNVTFFHIFFLLLALSKNENLQQEREINFCFCRKKKVVILRMDGVWEGEIHMYIEELYIRGTVWCMLWIITRFLNTEREEKIYMRQSWVWSSSEREQSELLHMCILKIVNKW